MAAIGEMPVRFQLCLSGMVRFSLCLAFVSTWAALLYTEYFQTSMGQVWKTSSVICGIKEWFAACDVSLTFLFLLSPGRPQASPSAGGRVAGLVYSYGDDDLNRTENIEDQESADEDSRESNSVSVWILSLAFWVLLFHSTHVWDVWHMWG